MMPVVIHKWSLVLVIAVVTAVLPGISANGTEKLLNRILDPVKYTNIVKMAPPTSPVSVTFRLWLARIQDFDVRKGRGQFNVWEEMRWRDDRLAWNSSDFDGITSIRLPHDAAWKPDMKLFSSPNAPEMKDYTDLLLYSTGDVTWIPTAMRTINCMKMGDVVWSCEFVYGPWVYTSLHINTDFIDGQNEIAMGEYKPSSFPVEIVSREARRVVKKYYCCPEEFTTLEFELVIKVKDDRSAVGQNKVVRMTQM